MGAYKYIKLKNLETLEVKHLIEEIIHLRELLANSRKKSYIFEQRVDKLKQDVELLTMANVNSREMELDHPLVGKIKRCEDFLYKNAGNLPDSVFMDVMFKLTDMTNELLFPVQTRDQIDAALN